MDLVVVMGGAVMTSDGFDPYHTWLGISPESQPAHHYRLLGLDPLEDDADVIAHAADRQMAHVKQFAAGKHGAQAETLLSKLAVARRCLLEPSRKGPYDRMLRESLRIEQEDRRQADARPPMPGATKLDPPARTDLDAVPINAIPPRLPSRTQKPKAFRLPAIRRTPHRRAVVSACSAVAFLALVGFGQTYGCLPGGAVACNYLCLVFVCAACVKGLQTLWFPRWVFYAATALVVSVALLIHGWTDTYTSVWTLIQDPETLEWTETAEPIPMWEIGSNGEAVTRFSDRYDRWGSTTCPVFRRIERFDKDSHFIPTQTAAGPMNGDHQQHGRWTRVSRDPYEHRIEWYWYGEEITEGEWHLRTR